MSDMRTVLERAGRGAAPPVDAFERLSGARRRRQRNRRTGAGLLACTVFAVGATGIFLAFRESAPSSTSPTQGYFVKLPVAPTEAPDSKAYLIDASTNLPNGTVVLTYFSSVEEDWRGDSIPVTNGHIVVKVANNSCGERNGVLSDSRFTLTLTIAPTYPPQFLGHGATENRPSPPALQPSKVLSILGQRFEHLEGGQVTNDRGYKQIVVSRFYQLPANTCTGVSKQIRVPAPRLIPGTDIPLPPTSFGFDQQDLGAYIRGTSLDNHLFLVPSDSNPAALQSAAVAVLDFYRETMATEGWTLLKDYPLHTMAPYGEPDDAYGGGQTWTRESEVANIHVDTWWPFSDPEPGYKLNILAWTGSVGEGPAGQGGV